MGGIRALVVFFAGGEPTTESIRNIRNILRGDDRANAQHVTIGLMDSNDLAKCIVSNSVVEHAQECNMRELSQLDSALLKIVNYYGDACKKSREIPIITMTKDFIENEYLRDAYVVISNHPNEELSINKMLHDGKISREFINKLKQIVSSLS